MSNLEKKIHYTWELIHKNISNNQNKLIKMKRVGISLNLGK
jgi:hypothetical protein